MQPSTSQGFYRTIILMVSVAGVISDDDTVDSISTANFTAKVRKTLKFVDAVVQTTFETNLASDLRNPVYGSVAKALRYVSDDRRRKRLEKIQCEAETNTNWTDNSILMVHRALNRTANYLKKKSTKSVRVKDFIYRMNLIDLAEEYLRNTIVTYANDNMTALNNRIDGLISQIERNNSGSLLIRHLGSNFFIALHYGLKNREQERWSTTTIIFNIYMTVASYAFRENAILRAAYKLKGNANDTYVNENLKKISSTKNNITQSIIQSVRRINDNLEVKDCVQKIHLKPPNDTNIVRIKNFLQLYYLTENLLSFIYSQGVITCRYNCTHWGSTKIGLHGCYGTARDCKTVPGEPDIGLILQEPQVDKIYTRILYDPEEITRSTTDFHLSKDRLSFGCEICACVCDQHELNTTRWFYGKPIKAPTGYVVTGARFVEKNQTIFLQIEVGKFLPLGIISKASVEWQNLPDDAIDHSVPLRYVYQFIMLNNDFMYKPDAVVTGFSFGIHEFGVKLDIYKQKIRDFTCGHLGDEVIYRPPTRDEAMKIPLQYFLDFSGKTPGVHRDIKKAMNTTDFVGIKFGMSSGDDFNQSCVPYFDGSNVTFNVKAPLADISFIHYTNHVKYAGYIRPVLRSIDYKYFFFSK